MQLVVPEERIGAIARDAIGAVERAVLDKASDVEGGTAVEVGARVVVNVGNLGREGQQASNFQSFLVVTYQGVDIEQREVCTWVAIGNDNLVPGPVLVNLVSSVDVL